MLSRKQHREMIDAYERARSLVEDAASIMEDESVSVALAGESSRRRSVTVIGEINNLCASLHQWSQFFEANAEVSE